MMNPRSTPQFYYGWVIVGLAFCSLAFWFGIRTSFSVFYVVLDAQFSWPPAALAGAQSAALLAGMIAAPLIGMLIDRYGPGKVILPGIVITTVGLALCATASSLFEFYLYYGIITGSAVTSIGVVAYSTVLRHWFWKKRGLASGIAVSGFGVGMLVFVPLVQYGIASWGWRNAFFLLSAFSGLCLLPLTVCLLRHKPGLDVERPDHEQPHPSAGGVKEIMSACRASPPELSLSDTVRQDVFWHFMLFAFFASVGVYIVLVHTVIYLVGLGTDAMVAATVFAMVGAISSVCRIFWGGLSDRYGRELIYFIGIVIACLGIGCLLLRKTSGWAYFTYLFTLLFGIGWGATAPSIMASSTDIFDGRQYGFIFGLVQGVINLGAALGAWLGGAIYGNYRSYGAAFVMAIVALAFSCLFIWKAAPRKGASSAGKPD